MNNTTVAWNSLDMTVIRSHYRCDQCSGLLDAVYTF